MSHNPLHADRILTRLNEGVAVLDSAGREIPEGFLDGMVTVLQAGREFKVLAKNQLKGQHMASAAVDGNAIILRTDKAIYRIEE